MDIAVMGHRPGKLYGYNLSAPEYRESEKHQNKVDYIITHWWTAEYLSPI